MSEKATPVSEQVVAPATVAPGQEGKPKKLSYAVSEIPNPVNNFEVMQHAMLVEARATRMALDKLCDLVEEFLARKSK